MELKELVGYIAATLTTASFVPQAWKVFKTRRTDDLSLLMYSFFTLGVALWMVYGFWIGSMPVALANSVTLMLAGYILVMKIRQG